MPKAALYNPEDETLGEMELSDTVFGTDVNAGLLHEVAVMLQANRRAGTASTKTRAEVRGGGRKPWRQKGLGRARAGTIRSPLWKGGGIVFGPSPRDYSYALPRKARREALRSALSARVGEGRVVVLERLAMERPRTASLVRLLDRVARGSALIVTADADRMVALSARNVAGVTSLPAASINALDVLAHEWLVLTRDAARRLEEALAP
jgi:large subunit ribosomal protein L4